jgi:flagellar hook-basal body complex protein FliE
VKSKDIVKFRGNLLRLLEDRLNTTNTEGGSVDLHVTMSKMANEGTDIEKLSEEFQEVLKAACDKSFRQQRTTKKTITSKSATW